MPFSRGRRGPGKNQAKAIGIAVAAARRSRSKPVSNFV